MISSQPSPNRRRHFGIYLFAGIALAVSLQVLIYVMVIQNTIGPVVFLGKASPADPAMTRDLRVALFRMEAGVAPAATATNVESVNQWQRALDLAGVRYQFVGAQDLNESLPQRISVLVMPSVTRLGDAQREAVSAAVAAGMGLVASGALGLHDAAGELRGWDFLTQMTGLRAPRSVPATSALSAAFRGQSFFSHTLPAGYNLDLPRQEFITGASDSPDAFWSDWKLRPAQGGSLTDVTLALHVQRGRGRVVWYGFGENPPQGSGADNRALQRYFSEAVRWTGRQPMAIVGDWPERKRAALLVAEDIGDAQSALPGVELLREEKIPAIFFFTSASARTSPAIMRTLETTGELASGGDSADPFGNQQSALQTDRLLRSKRELESLSRAKVLGFHPPQGSSNRDTAPSLLNAGYRYYLDSNGARRAVPEIMEYGGESIIPSRRPEVARIYRPASDDFEVISAYRGSTPWGDDLAEGFLSEFRRILYLGGAYPLVFQSELLGAPQNLHVLKTILRRIKQEQVWTASGEALVDWRSRRDKLNVEVRKVGPHRIRLAVTNRGQSDVHDASVYVYLPYRPLKLRVTPVMLQFKLPKTELAGDDDMLRLDIPTVRRQSSQVLLISLDEA